MRSKTMTVFLSLMPSILAVSTYRFQGNPYESTSDVTRSTNIVSYNQTKSNQIPPPFPTEFYYPEKDGVYPFVIFLGGFYSWLPGNVYDEYLSDLSKKGFVIGSSTAIGHMDDMTNMEIWRQQWDWHLSQANKILNKFATESSIINPKKLEIEIDPTKILLACQSAGCEILKFFANEMTDKIAAYNMLDPVPGDDEQGQAIVSKEVVTSAGVMIQSTEFCGHCCLDKWANDRMWDAFTSNDVKLFEDQLHTGHCSCLDIAVAKVCAQSCNSQPEYNTWTYLKKVHHCDVAKATAFFADAIWNDVEMRSYYQQSNRYCDVEFVDESTARCLGQKCL